MLIAIEGIDGSGKGVQASLLAERVTVATGHTASIYSFPRYDSNAFGKAVGQYLSGKFGGLKDVHPQLAAVLYAGDRYATKERMRTRLTAGEVVIADRYTASNVAHQAAKLLRSERAEFIKWITEIEYGIFEMPKPDLTIYLSMPVSIAATNVAKKKKRRYTNKAADIHEADTNYLNQCREIYDALCITETQWERVDCAPDNKLRTPEAIADEIWQHVQKQL